jgi:hypothetical protein
MRRRPFLALPLAMSAQAQTLKPAILELRYFYLRNTTDNMAAKTTDYLKSVDLPASERAGASGIGYFSSNLAPRAPFVLAVRSWPSMTAMEQGWDKLPRDSDAAYTRCERQILRAFDTMPSIAVKAATAARLFELRTYESNTQQTLKKKIGMFNDGEIAIFKKTGLEPVFFGEMLAGPNQPCLVYMLAYENFAAREKNWDAFINHPDWQKLRSKPGLSDGEIVSNISSAFLRPLPFSPIR